MTPNERPTPLTDSASFGTDDESLNRLYGIRELPKYVVSADFARTLERSLAERTEELESEKRSHAIAGQCMMEERDTALAKLDAEIVGANNLLKQCDELRAKLANCREAVAAINTSAALAFISTTDPVFTNLMAAIGDRCKSALEETK